jgi:hypothetical protein
MKKLIVTLSVLFLSSCALWDAHNMARFDNNEYYIINKVRAQALLGKEKCGTPEVKKYVENVWVRTTEFDSYASSIPNNEETIKMSGALVDIVKGLNVKYEKEDNVNKVFCEAKFELIHKNATTIQTVIGGKPR